MGGMTATRSAEQGAESALWALDQPDPALNGTFSKDGKSMSW